MEHLTVELEGYSLHLRDLEERDLQAIVEYWHTASAEYLEAINVDARKLTTRQETANRLRLSLPESQGERVSRAAVVVTLDDKVLAYSNLHIVSSDEVYAHVHVVQPRWRSRGLASAMFIPAMQVFVTHYPVQRLFFQTSSKNKNVNGFIQKFGLEPRVVQLDTPDGFAKPGEFFVYEVPKEIVESWQKTGDPARRNAGAPR